MPSADALVRGALLRGVTIGCAESLTGGALGAAIVDVPGASTVFRGSVVAYASDVKVSVLGVDAELLARSGAVSEAVALAMAHGARTVLGTDVGVSTTGAAGPTPHDGAAVGTVWVAATSPWGTRARVLSATGDRAAIRAAAVRAAIDVATELAMVGAPGGDSGAEQV